MFSSKHKVNKEIRLLLDIKSSIKNCLDDLFNDNYLFKEDYMFFKNQLVVSLVSYVVRVKVINIIHPQKIPHLFDQSNRQ